MRDVNIGGRFARVPRDRAGDVEMTGCGRFPGDPGVLLAEARRVR